MVCVSALWCFSQHLLSYLGFSYLGRGVSLHGCSSKAQLLLVTLDERSLFTAAPPDLERGVAPFGLPVPTKPQLLGHGIAPPSSCPWPRAWGSSSQPLLPHRSLAVLAATPVLGHSSVQVLTRHQIYWYLDLEIHNFLNCEKIFSSFYKLLSIRYFI